MPAPINPFKKALKEGRVQYGCWLALAAHNTAEMMGTAGFDWLVIDNEHAVNDLRSTRDCLIALESSDSHAIVRVPVGEPWIMKQMMDAGAQTILVPMVETAEQAREMVRAVQYPPKGIRGVGYSMTRSSKFGQIADYGKTADEQICLIVQVENRTGLANLDEILEVEGLDGVFIGPADLGADLGFMGDLMNPEAVKVILASLEKIAKAGKAPGILTFNDQLIEDAVKAGAKFVAVGADIPLLLNTAKARAAQFIG